DDLDVGAALAAPTGACAWHSIFREEAMLRDNTKPNRAARTAAVQFVTVIFALVAVVLAVVGGLWLLLFDKANADTEPPIVIASGCSRFEADAHKLFDNGETAALSSTFAPGDHVHLAIDFEGVGYSWELTGALAKKPAVTGSGWFTTFTTSTVSHGKISGTA